MLLLGSNSWHGPGSLSSAPNDKALNSAMSRVLPSQLLAFDAFAKEERVCVWTLRQLQFQIASELRRR